MRRAAAFLLIVAACKGPIDRKELHAQVSELHALAAEARAICEHDMPAPFFKTQRALLADKIHDAAKDLERPVAPSLQHDRDAAKSLAALLEPVVRTSAAGAPILPLEHELAELEIRLAP